MSNDVVFVTGSAVGIGRAACEYFTKPGTTVVAIDIDEAANQETRAAVEAAGGTCYDYNCDIGDKQAVKSVFNDLQGKITQINLLLNNAAVYNDTTLTGSDWETQTAAYDTAMNSCAAGAFYCTAAAVPLLANAGNSNIINLLTDHMREGHYLTGGPATGYDCAKFALLRLTDHVREGHYLTGGPATGYDCAKFALLRLTESWAVELKPKGVRVNGLCFGATDTPMLRKFAPQMVENGMKVEDLCQAMSNVINQGLDGATGQSYDFGMGPTPRAESLKQIAAIAENG